MSVPAADGTRPASPALQDASSEIPTGRLCEWCNDPIPAGARIDAEVCGVVCRKRRWRFRQAVGANRPASIDAGRVPRRRQHDTRPVGPARFAYADPPYPGKAGYYDERQEVDHASLLEQLRDGYPDGWALSTSAAALQHVLGLCPPGVRVCAWRRQVRGARSRRPLNAWEPLIIHGGRELSLDRPQEVIDHLDYRGRYDSYPGALIGMKPPEFAVWLFAQLGARAGDELVDLFPGSGAIGRAWQLYTSRTPASGTPGGQACGTPELGDRRDASHGAAATRDASLLTAASRDASPAATGDA